MAGRGRGIVQPAQGDEPGEELGLGGLLRLGLAMRLGQRVSRCVVAVFQQGSDQSVPFGPEGRSVIGRRCLRRIAGAQPQGRGIAVACGPAQGSGSVQDQAGIVAQRRRQRGHQRLGVRVIALHGQPRLGGGAVHRVQARGLAYGGRDVLPGQMLKPGPLVVGGWHTGPAVQERDLGRGIGQAGHPGRARRLGGLRVAAGNGQRGGAAEQARGLGWRSGGALGQYRRIVGFGGDRLLPPLFQQRLLRPVRAGLHEGGDLRRRGRAAGEQAGIQHQLRRHRIGDTGGCGLGLRPVVGSDRGQRVLAGVARRLCPRGQASDEQGDTGKQEPTQEEHTAARLDARGGAAKSGACGEDLPLFRTRVRAANHAARA